VSAALSAALLTACAVAVGTIAGCGGSSQPVAAPGTAPLAAGGIQIVAEGPCGRLSAQSIEGRTLLVYGETGYDLHDWAVGERLAAAQSFVQLQDGGAFRVPSLMEGLPLDAGGYVAADLQLGESPEEGPWLFAVETRYAARNGGRLFDRSGRAFSRKGKTWVATQNASPVPLPGVARSLPPLPLETACQRPGLTMVPLASTRLTNGEILVAGRCQDQSHVNYAETSVLVAHGLPGASAWRIEAAPDASGLDGIVNLALHARASSEAYLVAWEPFKPKGSRRPYLARWNGTRWQMEETGLPEGLMSVATTSDGALYVAAGSGLFRRTRAGAPFEPVPLPPLRFASEGNPPTLRIHTVRVVGDDLWIEGTYRVALSGSKKSEARASVLYRLAGPASRTPAMATPLFCDAREPADRAITAIEGSERRR